MSRSRWFTRRALGVIAVGGLVLCALQFYRAAMTSGSDGRRRPSHLLHHQSVDERELFAGNVIDRYDAVDERDAVHDRSSFMTSLPPEVDGLPGVDGVKDSHQDAIDQLRQWRFSGRSAKLTDIDRKVAVEQQRIANGVIQAAGIDVDAIEAEQLEEEDERDRAVELRYGKEAGAAARKSRLGPAISNSTEKPTAAGIATDVKPKVHSLDAHVVDNEQTAESFANRSRSRTKARQHTLPDTSSALRSNLTSVDPQSFQSAQQQQQQPRYIPHRCPRDMDIQDSEYDWFRSAVVQRSPASYPASGSISYSAAAASIYANIEDEILILTPISNAEKHALRYFQNICSLVYPHRLITVVLGEDSSVDKTPAVVRDLVEQIQPYFRRVELVRLPAGPGTRLARTPGQHNSSVRQNELNAAERGIVKWLFVS